MITGLRKYIIRDERGFNMVELFIAMAIGIIALAGSIKIFTTQQSLLKDENDSTKVRAKGRYAMTVMAREVRMAGFGLPKFQALDETAMGTFPSPAIVDSISFRTNKDANNVLARAYADPAGGFITNTSSAVSVFALESGTSFNSGDKIIIFNPSKVTSGQFHEATVGSSVSSGATSISYSPALPTTKEITFSPNANLVMVNRFIPYTLALNGNQIIKTIDGVNTVLVNNVAATASDGLKFHLLQKDGITEATAYGEVEIIRIVLNMIDPKNTDAAIEFTTDVQLRNSDS